MQALPSVECQLQSNLRGGEVWAHGNDSRPGEAALHLERNPVQRVKQVQLFWEQNVHEVSCRCRIFASTSLIASHW
jgi:hypothetical protein